MTRARRKDTNQREIVAALERVGCYVIVLHTPVDLLVWAPLKQRWMLAEVKREGARPRNDQKAQQEFIARFCIPMWHTVDEALQDVGAMAKPDRPA